MPRGVEIDPSKMRQLRSRALLTQEQLAQKAKCSVDLIQKCERSGTKPRVDMKFLSAILDTVDSELSDVANTDSNLRRLYEDWEEALSRCDVDAVLRCYHPEIVIELIGLEDTPSEDTYRGLDEARKWTEMFLAETSDFKELEKSVVVSGHLVLVDLKCSFVVRETKQHVETRCLRTFEYLDGLVTHRRIAADYRAAT